MSIREWKELRLPLTIEKQLENYSRKEGHSDRHEVLWHAWYQNKKWISQLLQITLSSFPTYSRHDESHALSVLNNIEMILGQERIEELSATDCFVLLHTVYIHDIGMCIMRKDRKEIIENDAFVELLDELEENGDENVKRAVEILKRTDYKATDALDYQSSMKELYRAKLDVYYAMVELLADYRRSEHGVKSAERLYQWTMEPEKLGIGFSMAGVPLRIFLAIARCAQMHTSNLFDDIKKLPRKDGGYASDYFHPRFIAVLLMLGDLLDMDNDRFHPMVMEFVEDFPETSKNHYDKHRAIRRLNISPELIEIEADCSNQNALRLVRKECDMLSDILRNAGYLWSSICPEGFRGSLPTLGETNLYLNGRQIPEELVTAQFHITQNKAFKILEGSNLYEGRFVFLREFLQNAVDATKLQYWYDYRRTSAHYYDSKAMLKKTPAEMNRELSMAKYPIELEMKMQKKDSRGKLVDVSKSEIEQKNFTNDEYGILVSIKDFGTGIDRERIVAIAKVGNSREQDKHVIQEMPKWLRPTAEFGVGLQSAFLLTDSFKCFTYTRSEQHYEITFSSGASTRYEGYINVAPVDSFTREYESYGTRFEIYIPLDKKFLHSESICTWSGKDLFSDDYNSSRPARHAAELISQMTLYVEGMLGELLFPIDLHIQHGDALQLMINNRKGNFVKKLRYEEKDKIQENECWLYRADKEKEKFLYGEVGDLIYALEYETAKLNIWDKELDTFGAVSGANLFELDQKYLIQNDDVKKRQGITIYYKGIELQHRYMEEEIEIFEYIDIKGNLERSYINISRRGFTHDGEIYFEEILYKKLLDDVKTILKDININHTLDKLIENIKFKLNCLSDMKKKNFEGESKKDYYALMGRFLVQILSLAILSHLAIKDTYDEISQLGVRCGEQQTCIWQKAVITVSDYYNKTYANKKNSIKEDIRSRSVLFRIQCYQFENKIWKPTVVTILDIFRNDKYYGILQLRESRYSSWTAYIFEIGDEYELFKKRLFVNEDLKLGDSIDQIDNQLSEYFEVALEKSEDIGVSSSNDRKDAQQFFMVWMGRNLPVIALFSDHSGNRRINVLSNYVFPYIYTNKNLKRLVIERIMETANEQMIHRFSTYAWQDRQYLAVKELPFSCYFVKRGFFNKAYLNKVIFPLDRSTLEKISEMLENVRESQFIKNVETLVERLDIKKYLGNLMKWYTEGKPMNEKEIEIARRIHSEGNGKSITSLSLDIYEFYVDLIMHIPQTINEKVNDKYFINMRMMESEWQKEFCNIIEIYLEMRQKKERLVSEIQKLQESDVLYQMRRGWYFVHGEIWNVYEKFLNIQKAYEEYREQLKTQSEKRRRERIIQYIFEHTYYPMKKEKIEICYTAFEAEIFDLFKEIEKDKMSSALMEILKL